VNKYEALVIFKASFDNDGLDQLLTKVENDMKAHGAKLFRTDKVGRKKLAYDIQKSREGLVAVVGFEAEGKTLAPMTALLNLNEDLIRCIILRNDELDINKPFIVTPVTGREPREMRGGRGGGGGGRGGPRRDGGGDRDDRGRDDRGPRNDDRGPRPQQRDDRGPRPQQRDDRGPRREERSDSVPSSPRY